MTVALGIVVAAVVAGAIGYRLGRRAGVYLAVERILDALASEPGQDVIRAEVQREVARRGWQ